MTEVVTDLSNVITVRKMVILPKTVQMKELQDQRELIEEIEVTVRVLDVSSVRNSVIWPKTAPKVTGTTKGQESQ